jgi:DNA invertase Pin-like site-specific DNA recombinase
MSDSTIFGYARVSTDGQSLDGQVEALTAAGAVRIFREKISGARADREELNRLLKGLGPGDILMVTRLDRLARSTLNLLKVLNQVTEKGAGFRSLAEPWADTTTANGRLMLTILGGFAEFERDIIRSRTQEGKNRARARGVAFGPKRKLTPHQVREALARREAGELVRDIARSYNVSHSTISRLKV